MWNHRHRLIVQGEVTALLSIMRGGSSRWGGSKNLDDQQDPLVNGLSMLQEKILKKQVVNLLDVVRPFCDIVVNEETTGPVTGQAIFALDKFLASGLFDPALFSTPQGIREVSEAVTHARFVGTNSSNDEVVLMRIIRVLNTLLSVPAGRLLTNESVCEIMQSCFRICFEGRLSELLHCFAENTLVEMIRILFSDLDSLKDTPADKNDTNEVVNNSSRDSIETVEQNIDIKEKEEKKKEKKEEEEEENMELKQVDTVNNVIETNSDKDGEEVEGESPLQLDISPENSNSRDKEDNELITSRGVHFATVSSGGEPHGMACIREVLRFLIAIINPRDRNNTDRLISIGLSLVTVMIECSGETIGRVESMRPLLQDGLSHHLLMLLTHDNLQLFVQTLKNCYLLFESCRQYLKLQLEWFLSVLMNILKSEKQHPARQEMSLECIIQMCHIPGFIPELYVNYDCSIYCSNVCEKLNKLLSKQVFPNTTHTLQSTNILALDTILAIVSSLRSCDSSHDQPNSFPTSSTTSSTEHGMDTSMNKSAGLIFSSTKQEWVESIDLTSTDVTKSEPNLLVSQGDPICDITQTLGTPSELLKTRQLKKLITAGTEQFNKKPSGGVAFLMEQGVLQTPMDPWEVAQFIHQNPAINKQVLGDYLGNKKYSSVLEAYVRSFMLSGVTLVDSLREFLEAFRLPGEAPVISNIMEIFSAHWMECNRDGFATVFANTDAVFVLCYAILMLQTDLHSSKLKQRMSLEEFIHTRRGMNNGSDFPRQLLTDIYNSIRTTEIILPSEHGGAVREDYEWKVLLNRCSSSSGTMYYNVNTTVYNQDVFYLCWGSAGAALSSALDNWPPHSDLHQKIMDGYRLCASIAAQYEQHEVFDNLIIQLSKFTSLLNPHEQPHTHTITQLLNSDTKAHLSLETLLSLAHHHGNLLREGWKNILDCLLALFGARLLPEGMVTVRDFLSENGSVSLYADEAPSVRPDSSLLSSFFSYNYWLLAGESSQHSHSNQRSLSPSEAKLRNSTVKWIQECGAELLFSESKFLNEDSLIELTKALIFGSHGPAVHQSLGTLFDEENAIFYMELLVIVTLENRDRVGLFLNDVVNHMTSIILSNHPCRRLRERAVIALIQFAIRLLHKDQAKPIVIHGLQSLLLISSSMLTSYRTLQRQISQGLVELIHSLSSSLHTSTDWLTLFSLLELSATTTSSHSHPNTTPRPTGRGVTEMGVATEVDDDSTDTGKEPTDIHQSLPNTNVNDTSLSLQEIPVQKPAAVGLNRFDLLIEDNLPSQDPQSFFNVCEALSYLVRDEQSITRENFTACLKTLRLFTEVTSTRQALKHDKKLPRHSHSSSSMDKQQQHSYATTALQLLDLLDTLYLRAGIVFQGVQSTDNKEEGVSVMWHMCWCPLLEGIARMCCDPRRSVRQAAIAYLQRALLAHTLHSLTEHDWEACFLEVFFPMLSRLMEEEEGKPDVEEPRMRACNLLCKVFLQRLPNLSRLSTFIDLWVGILDTMDKYMHIEGSELLPEAIPESLKNMLLVMVTQGVLYVGTAPPAQEEELTNQLWAVTWRRVEQFLPGFLVELFPQSLPPLSSSPPHSPLPPSPVMEQPRRQTSTPTHSDHSPSSSSPLSQSPGEEGASFPIVIHPPLPTSSPQLTNNSPVGTIQDM